MARVTRIALDLALASTKAVKPRLAVAWQYAKTEMAPPGTVGFLHGPRGKKLEDSVAKTVDEFITNLDIKIKEIDQAELKVKQDKEAAIKAVQERAKAETLAQEQKQKQEIAKRIKSEKEAKAKAEAKAMEEAKKAEKKISDKLNKNKRKVGKTDKSVTKKPIGKK